MLLGNLENFEGLKIPRAYAPAQQIQSFSSSEGAIVSDTLPSDYPSESHSEAEELDIRSLPLSSAGSFENRTCVQANSGLYTEHYNNIEEYQDFYEKEAFKKFNIQFKIKKEPSLSSFHTISENSSSDSISLDGKNLSTIIEAHEDYENIQKASTFFNSDSYLNFEHEPEIHYSPFEIKVNKSMLKEEAEVMNICEATLDDTEVSDTVTEPPISVSKTEKITQHVIDDVLYNRTKAIKTVEDTEKCKRLITEYKSRPRYIDPEWDVTIKNHPTTKLSWENFSDDSSYTEPFSTEMILKSASTSNFISGKWFISYILKIKVLEEEPLMGGREEDNISNVFFFSFLTI